MGGLSVSVFRPHVAQVSVTEHNDPFGDSSRASKAMPLTLAQLLAGRPSSV
jgi:hypothetical protein